MSVILPIPASWDFSRNQTLEKLMRSMTDEEFDAFCQANPTYDFERKPDGRTLRTAVYDSPSGEK